MRKHFAVLSLASVAVLARPSANATIYYVSQSIGSDSNPGTGVAPWKTVAKVNAANAAGQFLPGDQILFLNGDTWHEELTLGVEYSSASGDTLTSAPLPFAGTSAKRIRVGTYGPGAQAHIDSADLITGAWTLVSTGVYSKSVPAAGMPTKIFVDGDSSETTQLLPVPNARGEYSATATYQPFDLVTSGTNTGTSQSNPNYYIHGVDGATTGVAIGFNNSWTTNFYNPLFYNTSTGAMTCPNGCFAQAFSTTNTGLQNVTSIAGSYWSDGTTMYVHLPDGSDPSTHVMEGTQRPYGILLESTNYVTVTGFTVSHSGKSCIAAVAWSAPQGGSYNTNDYVEITRNSAYNCGDLTIDNLTMQGGTNIFEADILERTDATTTTHLLAGAVESHNYMGRFDSYIGLRGGEASYQAGAYMAGVDGGGTANRLVMHHNKVVTVNAIAAVYNTDKINGSLLNNGGRVAYNEFTNNQGNLHFSFTRGGRTDHMWCHETYGQCLQLGGSSIGPARHDHWLIVNEFIDHQNVDYNGIDCNGNSTSNTYDHITAFGVWGSSLTSENGCPGTVITNSVIHNYNKMWPAMTVQSGSNSYYFQNASYISAGQRSSNNYIRNSTTPHPFQIVSGGTSLTPAQFNAGWPDNTSVMGSSSDTLFVKPYTTAGQTDADYHILSTSPAYKLSTTGGPVGAFDNSADTLDLTQVGPQPDRSRYLGQFLGTVE